MPAYAIRKFAATLGTVAVAFGIVAATFALGTVSPHGSRAQAGSDVGAAADLVREWVESERVPGAVLLMSRDDRVIFERAYGWAQLYEYVDNEGSGSGLSGPSEIRRLRDPIPMTTNTVFDLASVTKVMATTFAIMLLVDAGELELDAPVQAYLSDFSDGGASTVGADAGSPRGKKSITVRQLLTHRSGLPQWKPIYYHAVDAEQAYAYIRDLPLAWSVGTERRYSDLGFMVLGRVVEVVSGESLATFLDQRLYGPLELSATGFRRRGSDELLAGGSFAATSHGNPYERRMVHDPDFGYRIEGDPAAWDLWRRHTLQGEVNDGNAFHAFQGMAGHAGLFSTVADLQILMQLLLNRGEYGGRRYVSAEVVDEFLAPTGDGQALGWQVPAGVPAGGFVHSGFTGTYVLGVPATGLALILLTNRQNLGVDDAGRYPDVGDLQRLLAQAMARQ